MSFPWHLLVLKSWKNSLKFPSRDRMSTFNLGKLLALNVLSSSSSKTTKDRISKPLKIKDRHLINTLLTYSMCIYFLKHCLLNYLFHTWLGVDAYTMQSIPNSSSLSLGSSHWWCQHGVFAISDSPKFHPCIS